MSTLAELREKTQRLLADPQGLQTEADLIDDGIRAALEAILPWIFKRSVVEFEPEDDVSEFELPADLYRIVSVFDNDSGFYIPQNTMSAGMTTGSDIQSNQDWLEYPEGYISLANPPRQSIVVYYGAVWEAPFLDNDDIEAPTWTHRALVFYAASYALLQRASSSANIRQWNIDADSGTPVMNPMRDMSVHYMERFLMEMNRVPGRSKGVHG